MKKGIKMKEGNDRILRVALVMLPLFIFFAFASVSYAFDFDSTSSPNNIYATVRVAPSVGMTCLPNPLVIGAPKEKVMTCYIELGSGYDIRKINVESLRLSLVEMSVAPIPVLANSPNDVGDFDKDGTPDLKVTFDKKTIDNWFSSLGIFLPMDFNFKLTGELTDIPGFTFMETDEIKVIKPSYTFVDFYGEGGEVRTIKGIDMNKAIIRGSRIDENAHQLIKLDQPSYVHIWTDIASTVTGDMPVRILPWITVNLGFTSWVRYEDDNCVFTPNISVVCDGEGSFFKRGLAVGYSRESVSVHFETDGKKATLIAEKDGIVVFEQLDVPMKYFDYTVKTTSSFLFV